MVSAENADACAARTPAARPAANGRPGHGRNRSPAQRLAGEQRTQRLEQRLLAGGGGQVVLAAGFGRRGQLARLERLAVDLAGRQARHLGHQFETRRDHISRQFLRQARAQGMRIGPRLALGRRKATSCSMPARSRSTTAPRPRPAGDRAPPRSRPARRESRAPSPGRRCGPGTGSGPARRCAPSPLRYMRVSCSPRGRGLARTSRPSARAAPGSRPPRPAR